MDKGPDPAPSLLEVRGVAEEFWRAARTARRRLYAPCRRNPCAARREWRRQIHLDQAGHRRVPARRGRRAPQRRRDRAAVGQGCGRCRHRHRLSGGQSAAESFGGAKSLSRPPADAVWRGSGRRDAPASQRAARRVRPSYRCGRAAWRLFGCGPACGRDRPRSRSVGAGADPRRAHLESRPSRGRDPVPRHAPARRARHRHRLRQPFSGPGVRDIRSHHRPAQRPFDRIA